MIKHPSPMRQRRPASAVHARAPGEALMTGIEDVDVT